MRRNNRSEVKNDRCGVREVQLWRGEIDVYFSIAKTGS